jgi:hypothetical protein
VAEDAAVEEQQIEANTLLSEGDVELGETPAAAEGDAFATGEAAAEVPEGESHFRAMEIEEFTEVEAEPVADESAAEPEAEATAEGEPTAETEHAAGGHPLDDELALGIESLPNGDGNEDDDISRLAEELTAAEDQETAEDRRRRGWSGSGLH